MVYYSYIINILGNKSARNKGKYLRIHESNFRFVKKTSKHTFLTSNKKYDNEINNFETKFKSEDLLPKLEKLCAGIYFKILFNKNVKLHDHLNKYSRRSLFKNKMMHVKLEASLHYAKLMNV